MAMLIGPGSTVGRPGTSSTRAGEGWRSRPTGCARRERHLQSPVLSQFEASGRPDTLARMSRWSRIASAACAVLLAGCGVAANADEPTPPPDAIAIRVYTNGGEGGPGIPETVHWHFRSVGSADQSGVVTHIPEATCIFVDHAGIC